MTLYIEHVLQSHSHLFLFTTWPIMKSDGVQFKQSPWEVDNGDWTEY